MSPKFFLIPLASKLLKGAYITSFVNAITNNPHRRLTKPSDIADFIEMLLSYESSWMTGNIIRVDGGEDITG